MIGIDSYFPQSHYGGGTPGVESYSQSNLDHVFGQSWDMTQMSLGAFKEFLSKSQKITDQFEARIGIMEVQGERLKEDLLNAPSVVQQHVKTAMDRNTKEQATVMASMQGPVARLNAMLMSKNIDQAQSVASSGIAEFIKEDVARKSMYYQQLAMNNQNIISALGGLSQANMQGMTSTQGMASKGLQTALGAINTRMNYRQKAIENDIERNKTQNEWNQNILDSQTKMAMNMADNWGSVQEALIKASSLQYNSFINAEAKTYGDMKKREIDLYKANVEDETKRDIAKSTILSAERIAANNNLESFRKQQSQFGMDAARLEVEQGNSPDEWLQKIASIFS